jgi:hypothetical protein
MTSPENTWMQTFPYGDGSVMVARLEDGWRLGLATKEVEARTLFDAFEELLGKRPGDAEMRVVVAALAWDDVFGADLEAATSADPVPPPDETTVESEEDPTSS